MWVHYRNIELFIMHVYLVILSRVVKAALCLAHGNADAERGLSVNKRQIGSDRTALSSDSINAIRSVKDAIRASDGIKKDLCTAVRASSRLEMKMNAKAMLTVKLSPEKNIFPDDDCEEYTIPISHQTFAHT